MRKSTQSLPARVVFWVVLLGGWALLSRVGPWPRYLLPGPGGVAGSLGAMAADGRLLAGVGRSLQRLLVGFGLSTVLGIPLGVAVARSQLLRLTLRPLVQGLQALPSICWLPLALLWFGLSESAIIFVVVMGSLLAISIATEDAVLGIPPQLLRVSGTLGIRGPRLLFGVLLPAALPGILTGVKLGFSFAWRALLAGELLFVSGGLGQLLTTGRELLDVAQVMAVMVAIVVVGMVIDRWVFGLLEVRVRRRWGLAEA